MSDRAWRVLDTGPGDGEGNMACDEAMLDACALGIAGPTLRFYAWRSPTLSLGYAQRADAGLLARCEANGVEVVRRPTGGRAVLHAGDFTFSVVGRDFPAGLAATYRAILSPVGAALSALGVQAAIDRGEGAPSREAPADCFRTRTLADLCVEGGKLLGGAIRRREGGTLLHGSIYMRYPAELAEAIFQENPRSVGGGSEGFPSPLPRRYPAIALDRLVGPVSQIAVAEAFLAAFRSAWGGRWEVGSLTAWELERIVETRGRYQPAPSAAPMPLMSS